LLVNDSRRVDADDCRSFARRGAMPDRTAAVTRAGLDRVEQSPPGPAAGNFRMPPQRADGPIAGISGNGDQSTMPDGSKLGVGRCRKPHEAIQATERSRYPYQPIIVGPDVDGPSPPGSNEFSCHIGARRL